MKILHETKRRKKIGVILKLDFEKADDQVNWEFLFSCLTLRGFDDQWCGWIRQVVTGGQLV
jgi:hypothetical protein